MTHDELVRAAQVEVAEIRARGEIPDPAQVQLAESEEWEAKPGDRVRLTYGDGSSVEGVLREVLELDDGTLHTHTRGQVRRDRVEVKEEVW